jgi:LmbE family N-acetylglucosaminyl deacetylase
MSLTRFILRFAAKLPSIEQFDRYLFIGPHPDDIEIGAGATAAKLVKAGKHVSFLICTDGRYGLETAPEGTTPDALAALRREEAVASAKLLGVTDVRFLDLSDGGLYDQKELLSGIARVIGETQPDLVFAPDPDVTSECHADHRDVGEAARRMANFAPHEALVAQYGAASANVQAIAFYMTAKPTRFVSTRTLLPLQLDAILCHKTQFTEDANGFKSVATYLKLRAAIFGLKRLCGQAEGFRVLGKTQMHCLPESGR